MKTWTGAIALIAAGALLSGSAFAQTSTAPGDTKDMPRQSTGTNPGSGSTGDAAKPDMKSDTMKSDSMKDATKGDMKARGDKAAKSGTMAGNREHVRAVQQALKDKGHDPGAIDGVMGPRTQAALKEFQGKEGLKASGRMDSETLAKLGVQAKAGASADSGASASPSASPSPSAAPSSSDASKPSDSAAPKSSAPSSDSSAPKK